MRLVEMYGYTQAGLTSGKRLQVQETLYTTVNGVGQYTRVVEAGGKGDRVSLILSGI
jgi:hypothetical protein